MRNASSFVVSCRQRTTTAQLKGKKEYRYVFLYVVSALLRPPLLLPWCATRDDMTTRRHNKTNGLRPQVSSRNDDTCSLCSNPLQGINGYLMTSLFNDEHVDNEGEVNPTSAQLGLQLFVWRFLSLSLVGRKCSVTTLPPPGWHGPGRLVYS